MHTFDRSFKIVRKTNMTGVNMRFDFFSAVGKCWELLRIAILPIDTRKNVWRSVRRIWVLTALTYLAFSTWFGEYLNIPEIICSG